VTLFARSLQIFPSVKTILTTPDLCSRNIPRMRRPRQRNARRRRAFSLHFRAHF
jgi:hypothetical protein